MLYFGQGVLDACFKVGLQVPAFGVFKTKSDIFFRLSASPLRKHGVASVPVVGKISVLTLFVGCFVKKVQLDRFISPD